MTRRKASTRTIKGVVEGIHMAPGPSALLAECDKAHRFAVHLIATLQDRDEPTVVTEYDDRSILVKLTPDFMSAPREVFEETYDRAIRRASGEDVTRMGPIAVEFFFGTPRITPVQLNILGTRALPGLGAVQTVPGFAEAVGCLKDRCDELRDVVFLWGHETVSPQVLRPYSVHIADKVIVVDRFLGGEYASPKITAYVLLRAMTHYLCWDRYNGTMDKVTRADLMFRLDGVFLAKRLTDIAGWKL